MGSHPDRFIAGLRITLASPNGQEERLAEVEHSWTHNGRLVLKFRGINSRTAAEAIEGWEVRIPVEERPPAPEGQHYLSDLIGFEVFTPEGRRLGSVSAWQDHGGPALLEVTSGTNEILVPLVPEICVQVDTPGRRIVAALPEGLEDLNRG
jgi:16S rRNA processing protein RimM